MKGTLVAKYKVFLLMLSIIVASFPLPDIQISVRRQVIEEHIGFLAYFYVIC